MNITELKELAEKATPGPWFVVGQPWNPKADFIVAGSEDPHVGQYVADTEDFDGEGRNVQENAAYIAAANPAEILELIANLEDAQGEIRALRATEAGLRERVKELESVLSQAREALAGGLWDYGPGQDEHEKCNEVIAVVDAALLEKKE